jgi:preprotein translocase subunit SecE
MKYKITVQINKRKVIAMFNIIVVLIAIFYLFIFVRNQTISDITSKKENETIETI